MGNGYIEIPERTKQDEIHDVLKHSDNDMLIREIVVNGYNSLNGMVARRILNGRGWSHDKVIQHITDHPLNKETNS